MTLPLTGWPVQVLSDLQNVIQDIVSDHRIAKFKIGRTNDLAARQRNYALEYTVTPTLHAIYQTTSIDHSLDVEDALIKDFFHHPKNWNENKHSGGNVSPDYIQYVYIALWIAA